VLVAYVSAHLRVFRAATASKQIKKSCRKTSLHDQASLYSYKRLNGESIGEILIYRRPKPYFYEGKSGKFLYEIGILASKFLAAVREVIRTGGGLPRSSGFDAEEKFRKWVMTVRKPE